MSLWNYFLNTSRSRSGTARTLLHLTGPIWGSLLLSGDIYQISNPAEADHTLIRSWIVTLLQNKMEARSVNRKIACLRSYYKFLLKTGKISQNPMLKVSLLKAGKTLPAFLPQETMQQLFEKIEFPNTFEGWRDKLMLELLYGTGMRLSELIGLTENSL